MSEKKGSGTQAKLPSSTREALQQHIAELGACLPATLERLARGVAARRHARCVTSDQPCDECNAREAVVSLLKTVARASSPALRAKELQPGDDAAFDSDDCDI